MLMNKKKGNPNKLIEINLKRKEKTLLSIRKAVEELNSLGFEPTISRIMEITNLSRATFQLEHIKVLMIELKIGKFRKIKIDTEIENISIDNFLELKRNLLIKEKQIKKQKDSLNVLSKVNKELENENNILRMKVYELQVEKDILMPIRVNN